MKVHSNSMGKQRNNSPALPPRGLRIMDAAHYMGVTPWYVEAAIRSGVLPALKLGHHYTILREDADAFLDRKREALENERRVRFPEANR